MKVDTYKLKEIIEKKGVRRKWLADKVGVSTHSIVSYIQGKRNPSRAVVKLLAMALNCEESDFVEHENPL